MPAAEVAEQEQEILHLLVEQAVGDLVELTEVHLLRLERLIPAEAEAEAELVLLAAQAAPALSFFVTP